MICHSIVPIITEYERASEGLKLKDIWEVSTGRIVEIPMIQKSMEESAEKSEINEAVETEKTETEKSTETKESTQNEESTKKRSPMALYLLQVKKLRSKYWRMV